MWYSWDHSDEPGGAQRLLEVTPWFPTGGKDPLQNQHWSGKWSWVKQWLQHIIQTCFLGRKVTVKGIMKSTVFHCNGHWGMRSPPWKCHWRRLCLAPHCLWSFNHRLLWKSLRLFPLPWLRCVFYSLFYESRLKESQNSEISLDIRSQKDNAVQ